MRAVKTMKAAIRATLNNSMRSMGDVVLGTLPFQGYLRRGFANHSAMFHEFPCCLLAPGMALDV